MTRPLRVGDRVTATGTIAGPVGIGYPDGWRVTWTDGDAPVWQSPVPTSALTLIAPAEPRVGSVVVKDGVAWVRDRAGWRDVTGYRGCREWDDISDGEVIFIPGGDA
jgi:hypothetical protein